MSQVQLEREVLLDEVVFRYPDHIIQVRIPLPLALKYVNAYILRNEDNTYTVIDPGMNTPEACATWDKTMAVLGINYDDFTRIVLTHQHPDHYGLAGWFQQRSGRARVWMSKAAHEYALSMWANERPLPRAIVELYALHGVPEDHLSAIKDNFEGTIPRVLPHAQEVEYIEHGQRITFGNRQWQLIDAPGHARGQILFYDESTSTMMCGDQVLPTITPNVAYVPGRDEHQDPLAMFMNSLHSLRTMKVERAYPGHRWPFASWQERIDQLLKHHDQRLEQIVKLLSDCDMKQAVAYELCLQLFGEAITNNPHHLRFAMAETLAHLFMLRTLNRVSLNKGGEWQLGGAH